MSGVLPPRPLDKPWPYGDDSGRKRRVSDSVDPQDDGAASLQEPRAAILHYLATRGKAVEKLELVTTAVRTTEVDRRDISVTDLPFQTVHDRVVNNYLPALAREGLIDYNRSCESITLAVPPEDIPVEPEQAEFDQ